MTLAIAAVFAVRAAATALLVIVVARVAERAGPFVASAVLTLPLYAGPSYFFLLGEVAPEFLAQSALFAFAGTAAVLGFACGYGLAITRFGLPATITLASLAWFAFALPLRLVPLSLAGAFAWIGLGLIFAQLVRPPPDVHRQNTTVRARWLPLVARAGVAGLAVATVALLGPMLGPSLTGLAVAFPVVLIVSIWMVHRQYGAAFSAAVMASTRRTLLSYASFNLVLALLATRMPVEVAFTAAVGASVASALAFALFGLRARRAA